MRKVLDLVWGAWERKYFWQTGLDWQNRIDPLQQILPVRASGLLAEIQIVIPGRANGSAQSTAR
jgi:hypothetical protein